MSVKLSSGSVACMVNGRYRYLSTFQCVVDVCVWGVSVCVVCQCVASVSVWRVLMCDECQCMACVSVWEVSVCGGCQCIELMTSLVNMFTSDVIRAMQFFFRI